MIKKIIFILLTVLTSCIYSPQKESEIIASYENSYLLKNEFLKLMNDVQIKDSLTRANYIINEWATEKILIDYARLNLDDKKIDTIEYLVQKYRSSLLTESYLEALINSEIDLKVDSLEIDSVFNTNKELFFLKNDIFKHLFIKIPLNFSDSDEVIKSFKNYRTNDQLFLDSISFRYSSFLLNNISWSTQKKIRDNFYFIDDTRFYTLKKNKFLKYEDSLGLYLIKIIDSRNSGEYSPKSYILPTLEYISLNNKKRMLSSKIKSKILSNAILKKKLEIY
ncbi:MAG: hypothetical protein CMC51_03555 [Flavobacteriaceae bacterium]|nr:hypothetical protein [Flavobacteriaceae bacterium]